MAKRPALRATDEDAGCAGFDAALEEYLDDGDAEGLLRAACMVAGSARGVDPKSAFIVAELTGASREVLVDYDDAGRAVRRWFAVMAEPGARH